MFLTLFFKSQYLSCSHFGHLSLSAYESLYRIQSFGHVWYVMYSTTNLFHILFASMQLSGKPLLLENNLSLNNMYLAGDKNVHCQQAWIKSTICTVNCMKRFLKKSGDLMISYLKIFKKHAFDIPWFTFKLYSNICYP